MSPKKPEAIMECAGLEFRCAACNKPFDFYGTKLLHPANISRKGWLPWHSKIVTETCEWGGVEFENPLYHIKLTVTNEP